MPESKKPDWSAPAFSDALDTLTIVETAEEMNKLTIERENKILLEYGFGFYDVQNACIENMQNAFSPRYMIIMQSYLNDLSRNLRLGTPVSFLGANGSGKTNGMATLTRQIIKKYYDPSAGMNGRVRMSIMMTPCYSMIEDYLENALGEENIYTVVNLLLIDDVDRDYTGHRRAAFQSIIAARAREQGKPFFLTTAMNDNEFAAQFPHVYSRLKTGIVLKTKDQDLRNLRR